LVQFKRTKLNDAIVKDLMERSFSFRRLEILEDSLTLPKIFERFPFVQDMDIVLYKSGTAVAFIFPFLSLIIFDYARNRIYYAR